MSIRCFPEQRRAVYRLLRYFEERPDADPFAATDRVPPGLRIWIDYCVTKNWLSPASRVGESIRRGFRITDTGRAVLAEQRWLDHKATSEPDAKAEPTKDGPTARRTGRPRKGESSKDMLVVAALAKHHQYESGGSIGNYEPATVRGLAKPGSGLTTAAVSRFFRKKFDERGHKGYVAACTSKKIGPLLAAWQHDVPTEMADLLAEEYGRDRFASE